MKAQIGLEGEWKLQCLPVAVTAALEEIRAVIPDSLLRTGAGLGHKRLAGGLSYAVKVVIPQESKQSLLE